MGELRTISINRDQIDDVLISHLYAIGVLRDSENATVLDIEYNNLEEMMTIELDIALRFPRGRNRENEE